MTNEIISTPSVSRQLVAAAERINLAADLFAIHFPLRLEPSIFRFAGELSHDYHGGYWLFYTLSNGGFYMAPDADMLFHVSAENGYEGTMSADALGITACLYAYSHLSFSEGNFAETCARQYHRLREYMMDHAEAGAILGATD